MSAIRLPHATLQHFVLTLLKAYGVDEEQATCVARILVWCDLVGRPTQGVERLAILLKRVEHGLISTPCLPRQDKQTACSALIDGAGGFGHYVGDFAMRRAIELAAIAGIGVVGVRNSNYFGAGAYYVNQAAEAGMIGIAMSNSFPKVAAHGGSRPILGTNPFAFGAPTGDGRHLLLDMATSSSAGSTVREIMASGGALPEQTAVDATGAPLTDPSKLAGGALLPFGGAKGYGLAIMVEVLAGIITGAGFCHGVGSMYGDFSRSSDNGHFMLALDIGKWMAPEIYVQRMDEMVAAVRRSGQVDAVHLPGETRWAMRDENLANGIPLAESVMTTLEDLARSRSVPLPWTSNLI